MADRIGARVALSVAVSFVALAIQWVLWDYFKPYVWFLFFPAAFFSAWIGGLAGGLVATLVSALLVWFFFIPPTFSFALSNPAAGYSIIVFVLMGALFSWFHERLRLAMLRTDEARASAEATNDRITRLYEKTLELDKLKDQFFANVSHELRTPLTLILAPLEQRLRRPASADSPAEEQHETEIMLRNARLLYRHVTDLLDVAKLESGGMTLAWSKIDLARLLRNTAANFESAAAQRHIAYTLNFPPTLPCEADAEKVQRVVLNLLSNAFKFTPDGGAIALRLSQEGSSALIDVQDNGPGIPVALREAVFERFRQG
ncbi:HAMP domain-containing histidine kinase, partial [bacterium]|nr:HAMP domain-containing histidine kinase [bacterium]